MSHSLTDHLVVPVVTVEDARATAAALKEYPCNRITVVHVVEKAGGEPDKLPLEQAQSRAEDSFAAFREIIPDIETEITYATDVVTGINDIAVELEADAIAFRPRGGNRIVQLLAGDKALRLVTETELPVIAFHDVDGEDH
ncbi:universal stress protein [Natrinema sp. LN54]|uniref:universal stress protein n=1 Tax=Natrinema sp. LN54 TaxID=3458705 RepID=UPI0040365550